MKFEGRPIKKFIWRCCVCNSSEVDEKVWVNMNDPYVQELGELSDIEDYWCNNCSDHVEVEPRDVVD